MSGHNGFTSTVFGSDDDEDGARKRRGGHLGRPRFNIERFQLEGDPPPEPRRRAPKHVDGAPVVEDLAALMPTTAQPKFTPGDLSEDQIGVYQAVLDWHADTNRRQYLKFGGLAGTGKTTLVSVLVGELKKRNISIACGAYTGKAANVLGRKLKEAGAEPYSCGTLHSLMYGAIVHDHSDPEIDCNAGPKCKKIGRIDRWGKKEGIDAGLVIVDEASMVGKEIWDDLLSFGLPVLAVGDHGQLPPIGKDSVNLMQSPDLKLEKIHRQAEGNPILAFAHHVRQGGHARNFPNQRDPRLRFFTRFMDVVGEYVHTATNSGADQTQGFLESAIICGKNATRNTINRVVREARGFGGPVPDMGDIVIALRNFKPVFNGMRGVFEGATYNYNANDYGAFDGSVCFIDDRFRVNGEISAPQFGREKTFEHPNDMPGKPDKWTDTGLLFDFGYALTCHKAQGSQFTDVVVCAYDTFGKNDDRRRWLYTAATRASQRLVVVC